jgi:type IV pilus assembly protein PilE
MNKTLRRKRGVTLLELMVVVAIIGILAAIAVPTYLRYTTRAYRASARACLMEAAQFMERYYTTNFTYVGADAVLIMGCATESGMAQRYTITAGAPGPAPTQRTFTVVATPILAQATRDTECGTMSLNEVGTRTAGDNSVAALERCW